MYVRGGGDVKEGMVWDPSPHLRIEAFSTVGATGGQWRSVRARESS